MVLPAHWDDREEEDSDRQVVNAPRSTLLEMTPGTIEDNRYLTTAHATLFAVAVLLPAPLVTGIMLPYRVYYGSILAGLLLTIFLGARLVANARLSWLLVVWAPFVACTLLSVAASNNPSRSLASFASFSIRAIVVAAILHAALNSAGVRGLSRFMTVIAFVAGVNGFLELVIGFNVPYAAYYAHMDPALLSLLEARGGVVGTIGHPLPFGALLAMFIPIALALPISKRFRTALAVGLILGVIASLSRASLLAGAVGTSFMAGVATTGSLGRRLGAVVVPLISAAIIWMVVGSMPFGKHLVASASTENHRYGAFLMTGTVLHEHPFLGLGQGLFEENYARYRPRQMSPLIPSPDNQYLRRLMETGIIGFAALLWALGAYALKIVTSLRKGLAREQHTLLAGLGGGLLAGCAAFFFFDGYIWLSTQLAFFSIAGAATALCESGSVDGSDKKRGTLGVAGSADGDRASTGTRKQLWTVHTIGGAQETIEAAQRAGRTAWFDLPGLGRFTASNREFQEWLGTHCPLGSKQESVNGVTRPGI